jgi:hypothetical protein
MAKRPGFFRRIIQRVFNPESEPAPPPPSEPEIPPPPTLSREVRINRAVNNIVRKMPLANKDKVRDRLDYMDDSELQWTIRATLDQLKWRARQDADRMTDDYLPLNPWWYH